MHSLVIFAHPDPHSFSAAARDAAIDGLVSAKSKVESIDLYQDNFQPWMSAQEHQDYYRLSKHPHDPLVEHYLELLFKSHTVVFVYPTWWSGLPAILQGWIEKVLLPGFAFEFGGRIRPLKPQLGTIKQLVGITSYGSSQRHTRFIGDNGRRTITRSFRAVCSPRCKTKWLGLHAMDRADQQRRQDFLKEIAATTASLRS